MACFKPVPSAISVKPLWNGKRKIKFGAQQLGLLGGPWEPINLPCGQCIGCRIEHSRQWAIRCVHEASLWDANSFITLTYANDQLPPGGSLYYPDFKDFMKRFRSALDRRGGPKVRFYMCGEYGEKLSRPHYHALMFNWWPSDARLWKQTKTGPLFTSEFLSGVWGHGYAVIGSVTFESAAYVSRYITKKITGEAASDHYETEFYDDATGEIFQRLPEFTNMSRKPGIAHDWFQKWKGDVYPADQIVLRNGRVMRPPRYYDRKFELEMPAEFELIKQKRKVSLEKMQEELTIERLNARQKVAEARLNLSKRNLGL